MDEVSTTGGDRVTVPTEAVTLEQVAIPDTEASLPVVQTVDPKTAPETIQGVPLDDVVITPVAGEPELPTIQVEPSTAPTPVSPTTEHSNILQRPEFSRPEGDENGSTPVVNVGMSDSIPAEPRVVERVVEKVVEKEVIKEVPVEKIVEKEVIKEVPVEKIVEKIVYRDALPAVCPPPTREEREAIYRDFLIELSHEGTAKKHALMIEKLDAIMKLFDTKERIMHKDVREALECSGTTATRLLSELRHEGKITLHGTGGNGATYTKNL